MYLLNKKIECIFYYIVYTLKFFQFFLKNGIHSIFIFQCYKLKILNYLFLWIEWNKNQYFNSPFLLSILKENIDQLNFKYLIYLNIYNKYRKIKINIIYSKITIFYLIIKRFEY